MIWKSILNKYYLILLLLIIIFVSYFTYLSFLRYDGLKTQLADLGIVQAVYNTLEGRFLMLSDVSRLYLHANFILLFFAPLYYFFPTPKSMLFFQVLIAGLGAIPIFWLAKDKLKSKNLGLLFAFLYLINPQFQDAVLYDFHPEVIAVTFLLFAFYFLEKKNYLVFSLFAGLAILSKENISLVIMMMGVYHFFINKRRKAGVLIAAFGLLYFLLIMQIVIPYFNQGQAHPFLQTGRYSYLGENLTDAGSNILRSPWLVLTRIFSLRVLIFLVFSLAPLAFTPFFGWPVLLIALPDFLINALNDKNYSLHPFGLYHQIIFVAVAFIAAIYAIKTFQKKSYFNLLLITVFAASTIFSLIFSPASYSLSENSAYYQISENAKIFQEQIKKMIPDGASLSVQNNLGTQFINREKIHIFSRNSDVVDYILLDLYDQYPYYSLWRSINFPVLVYTSDLGYFYQDIEAVFRNEDYGVLFFGDHFYLFKKGYSRDLNEPASLSFQKDFSGIIETVATKERERCEKKVLKILSSYFCNNNY